MSFISLMSLRRHKKKKTGFTQRLRH